MGFLQSPSFLFLQILFQNIRLQVLKCLHLCRVCLWHTGTPVLFIRLNRVHRLNVSVRRQTLYLQLTGDLSRSSQPLLFLNQCIVPSGSDRLPADIGANRSFGGWCLRKFAAGNFWLLFTPPQWHLHTFSKNMQAHFKSWDVSMLTTTITK